MDKQKFYEAYTITSSTTTAVCQIAADLNSLLSRTDTMMRLGDFKPEDRAADELVNEISNKLITLRNVVKDSLDSIINVRKEDSSGNSIKENEILAIKKKINNTYIGKSGYAYEIIMHALEKGGVVVLYKIQDPVTGHKEDKEFKDFFAIMEKSDPDLYKELYVDPNKM